jgi:hypothetical protein
VLTGERRDAVVDQAHDPLVDVRTDHRVTLVGELHRQRQADLAQCHHTDLHAAYDLTPTIPVCRWLSL